jgi:L-threonylcarbamoyladenylate synthase
MTGVDAIVGELRAGALAVLPTDTVYGLVCSAEREQPAGDLYRLKGRPAIQPTAVLFASVHRLVELLPGLDEARLAVVQALLPGPYTLVVPNAEQRFAWLTAGRPEAIGIRVPLLPEPTEAVVEQLGAVVATSANLRGGRDPRRLDEVPQEILDGVAAAVDGGLLPGTPSTVIDLTGDEPVVLRAGAADPGEALARIAAAWA